MERRLVFNEVLVSSNRFFKVANSMSDEELGAYAREFFLSLMCGEHMNDELFDITYTENKELAEKNERRREAIKKSINKYRAKKRGLNE